MVEFLFLFFCWPWKDGRTNIFFHISRERPNEKTTRIKNDRASIICVDDKRIGDLAWTVSEFLAEKSRLTEPKRTKNKKIHISNEL